MEKVTNKQSALTLAALGVVYGDIGTSPLYAMKEVFAPQHGIAVTVDNVLGAASLIIWSLIVVVSLKYVTLILRADNRGEGGIMALLALALGGVGARSRQYFILMLIGLAGTALFYGDGVITPAITILSAVEGMEVATPLFKPYVVAIAALVVVLLYCFQQRGSAGLGRYFGPFMVVWFGALAIMGVINIIDTPLVLKAFHPAYALRFFIANQWFGFVALGAIFLSLTGAEALYADMGHFGKQPIRRAWFFIVFPALVLNYLGQSATLINNPAAAVNPFYYQLGSWSIIPLVVLATLAAVIAAQATIAATFSVTQAAISLGFLPRMKVVHTSDHERGQIYIPLVNWLLMFACLALVLAFRTSTNLAAAYGVAVTMTMLITTVLFYFAARHLWHWSLLKTLPLCLLFAVIELAFLSANLVKFFDGGWFPLVVGGVIFALMTTWAMGRRLVRASMEKSALSQETLCESLRRSPPVIVPGTAIFMSSTSGRAPIALLHSLKHYRAIHERVIFMTLITQDEPWVPPSRRVQVEIIAEGFWRVTGRFGFMQKPDVPRLLRQCASHGLEVKAEKATFFLGREIIVPSPKPGMARWREQVFALSSRLAQQPATYFQIPVGRVIELGQQVEI